jgi:hypothetical protein
MLKFVHQKFFSWLLLVVMLAAAINGLHECAHAMEGQQSAASVHTSPADSLSAPHDCCPASPLEQHEEADGCDCCVNCACHAPLSVQPFRLSFNPIILSFQPAEPFQYLPEVYLAKFVPPQNLA